LLAVSGHLWKTACLTHTLLLQISLAPCTALLLAAITPTTLLLLLLLL
jgi:hypothetical protein